ncbi:spore germination protein [Paenibacillus sp. FSL H7-0323]|uniref:spore germination protein n=1 Tax=Paenibacillus sp. FSL H7-0323 TaxID=2921433 RepID=UPI0030FB703E
MRVWNIILEIIPKWSVIFQAIMIFFVPFILIRMMSWANVKEDTISTRAKKAAGSIGGGVPYGEASLGSSNTKKVAKADDSVGIIEESSTGASYSGQFREDLQRFKEMSTDMHDVSFRELRIGGIKLQAALIFVDGLTDKDKMDRNILKPLMNAYKVFKDPHTIPEAKDLKDILIHEIVLISEVEFTDDVKLSLQKVLFGSVVLLVEGIPEAIVLSTPKGNTRGIEEPESEAVLRGSRSGFNETLSDNTALLRRHGQSTELAMISFTVGKRMKKDLVLTYIKDIANDELVEEVKRRIRTIDIDDVQESGYVEQLIEDNSFTPFQQIQNTERPDRVMAALLEGRVAILLDGTPFALIMPVSFGMLLQSPEDYYDRWMVGSLVRLLRFLAALISMFAPALYISFLSFQPGLIPTKLAISIISSRQGVPFTVLIEALIMETSIEILREAGLRLPKPIGPAMGIVGGLIIGQAAVEAGIVSPILVIVVSVTAISSFTIPMYSAGMTLRMLRFVAMFFAAVFGLYGVVLFFLFISAHLIKLKSFGMPYLGMFIPYKIKDWKDFIFRMPLQFLTGRPTLLKPKDPRRKG